MGPRRQDPRSPTDGGPALGLIELSSVSRGMVVADGMVKSAASRILRAAPTTPGKYVVIVGGGEEEVLESMKAGLRLAASSLIDQLYLARIDAQVPPVLRGELMRGVVDGVAVVETYSVAATVVAADAAAKMADIRLIQMRLARGLGGKAFFTMSGDLPQLEAGVEAARRAADEGMLMNTEIIARPHPDFVEALLNPPEA
jgi:microcompartment protein CcmL/EutN